jgi:Gamma-glutamyl cyclotransferase, AIG2-like
MTDPGTHQLFSYGTLQLLDVQLARFGRVLQGHTDALPGYRLTMIEITDPEVIALSGTSRHPLVLPSAERGDAVDGSVFTLTDAELASADEYEAADYARVLVTLLSGAKAWAYLDATGDLGNP